MNQRLIYVLLICTLCACPAASITRWFSATYNDLKFTLYRYGHCYAGLLPLNSTALNETQFLVQQIKSFVDQGNYDNEQLANVSGLMDDICRSPDYSYGVSLHINISKYENETGKVHRCEAIEEAMNAMYYVFKRAALNRSEPLDFSNIQFYPDPRNKTASYSLVDLINVSWIKSNTDLDRVCSITNPIKEYVQAHSSKSQAQARAEQTNGPLAILLDLLNRMLDPILGLQKRLYWEGSNRLGQFQTRLNSGVDSLRGGIGSGLHRTRQRLFGSRSNVTSANSIMLNSTQIGVPSRPNSTSQPSIVNNVPSSTPAPTKTTIASPSASVTTSQAPSSTAPAAPSNFTLSSSRQAPVALANVTNMI